MGRHVVTVAKAATATTPALKKGQVIELTPAQEADAASSLRVTTFRDTTGENVGVSN